MYEIISETDMRTIPTTLDCTIMEAMLNADINHIHACDGKARCTTCRVFITEGLDNCTPRNELESELACSLGFPDHIRLACQTKLRGNISLRRPETGDFDRSSFPDRPCNLTGMELGQERELAILVTDIENYTNFAEQFPAYDVVHVLNRYYQAMNQSIVNNGGIISDLAGDGILALFGLAEKGNDCVRNAIGAVRSMNQSLEVFNRYLENMYAHSFGFRAGIHFGRAIVGHLSHGMLSKIGATGDAVNTANRLQLANKELDTRLLISEAAYRKIQGDDDAVTTHHIHMKGKADTYPVFSLKV